MCRRISSPLRLGRAGLVILTLLMALTLACEGANAFSAASGDGGVGDGGGIMSPEAQLLQRSLELTDELQSFRAHVDMEMNIQGQQLPISFDMSKAANGRIRLVMDMDAVTSGMRMEMIIADEQMFSNLPGVGWVRMDASAMSGIIGQAGPGLDNPMELFSNLFPSGDLPPDMYNVQSLGKDEVDGVPTEHLLILMDIGKIMEELGKSSVGQFTQLTSLSGQSGNGGMDSLGINEIEVWIDDDGYNRRTVMKIELAETNSLYLDMRMFGFNDDISVDLPSSYSDLGLN